MSLFEAKSTTSSMQPFPRSAIGAHKLVTYTSQKLLEIPEVSRIPSDLLDGICLAAMVFPFKVNSYALDHLINWAEVPDDPMFRLLFPHPDMLDDEDIALLSTLVRDQASPVEVDRAVLAIRARLNPHSSDQIANVPILQGRAAHGIQHKYENTVLFFPKQGQTCHSYCTFCFRWPQFVSSEAVKFESDDAVLLHSYLRSNGAVTDLLLTGGDPLVMNARRLRGYLEPLLSRDLSHVKNIRLGTKSLSYWPYRYLAGADAQELLDLIERLVSGGKHVAIMAHINHWREMAPAPFQEAVYRLRQAGAVIRTQSPLLRHINDAPEVWSKTWTEQVRQGMVPYYMFIERDTGPSRYFGIPLSRALHIFNEASTGISGICKTARGPVMSAGPGKVQIVGVIEVCGRKHFVLTFLQARDSSWLGRPFLAEYSETAQWLDQLVPADGGRSFFYEKAYAELLDQKRVSTASVGGTYAHTRFKIAIVGGGPRCLTLLDQLSLATRSCGSRFDVVIYDPNQAGEGAHPVDQDPCLLTNTLASQVTIYAPTRSSDPNSPPTGPSFTDWARAAGYRRVKNEYLLTKEGEPISEDDYLPRSLLGLYLRNAFQNILARMPSNVSVRHQRDSVVEIDVNDLGQPTLTMKAGDRHTVDFLFLTTGHSEEKPTAEHRKLAEFAQDHTKANPRVAFISHPYPLNRLNQLSADSVVALQGLGLTAYDVIASLTLGRGGRYEGDAPSLRYVASGDEPQIRIFSRSAIPFAARGKNQKGIGGRHVARFFTPAVIETLRAERERTTTTRKLDFCSDVLPLIKLEMAYAYRCAVLGRSLEPDEFVPSPEDLRTIDDILDPPSLSQCTTFDDFSRVAQEWLVHDLVEAYRGNLTSPAKAATDVIRDTRDALSAAVEHCGLTPRSHRWFCERFVGIMNRVAFGPPRHRNAELVALIQAGIVGWAGGPGCVVEPCEKTGRFAITTRYPQLTHRTLADVLIVGRLPVYRPERDTSLLTAALLKRGLIRPFLNGNYHPSGLDLDEDQHPVARDGVSLSSVWVLGYPAEGTRFYTYALPRPQRRATQTVDAERAVLQMLLSIERIVSADSRNKHDDLTPKSSGAGEELAV